MVGQAVAGRSPIRFAFLNWPRGVRLRHLLFVASVVLAGIAFGSIGPSQAAPTTEPGFELLPSPCVVYDSPTSGDGSLVPGTPRTIQVTGASLCVPDGATAVVLSVTAVAPQATGNFRLSASGVTPAGGVVTYAANGLNNSNTVTIQLSEVGAIDVAAHVGATDVRLVAIGLYSASGTLKYFPLTSCAVADSRLEGVPLPAAPFVGPFTSASAYPDIDVVGTFSSDQGGGNTDCGVPAGADAVVVNVVAIGATGTGGMAVGTGGTTPSEPTTNFAPIPLNNAAVSVVAVDGFGKIAGNIVGSGSVDIRLVVLGYLDTTGGEYYLPVNPCAAFDSRETIPSDPHVPTGLFAGKRIAGVTGTTDYQVTGAIPAAQGGETTCEVPAGAAAVLINLVAIQGDAVGNFQAFATGATASGGVLNFNALSPPLNNSNAVVVPLDSIGRLSLYVNGNPGNEGNAVVHARGVILGYFGSPPAAVDDGPNPTSSPGDNFHTAFATALVVPDGNPQDLQANDTLGAPEATIVSFGGADMPGTVDTNTAGSTVVVPQGTVQVNADGSFSFTPVADFTGSFSLDYMLANAVGTDDARLTIAVGSRSVSTTADSRDAIGNVGLDTSLAPSFSVIDNDTGDGLLATPQTLTSTAGAAVEIFANGQFTYDPLAGYESGGVADTFTYQVSNGWDAASGTVSIDVDNMIWFIDKSASAGTGTLLSPFNTIAQFNGSSLDATNETIFIKSGGGAYSGSLAPLSGQKIIGTGSSASLADSAGITVPPNTRTLPPTGGTRPLIVETGPTNSIVIGTNNTIRGLDLQSDGTGLGIAGTAIGTLHVADLDVDSSGPGIDLTGGSGSTLTFDTVNVTSASGLAVSVHGLGSLNVSGGSSNITALAGAALNIDGTDIGPSGVTFASISSNQLSTGSDVPAIQLTNTGSGDFAANGGTIRNITDSDGIRLNNTDGGVLFGNMIIQDISGSTDATAGSALPASLSGADGIHGQNVNGGLTLNGTTMRRFSDSAINGSTFAGGADTDWDGLTILNSTLEDSNRYHVGGTGAAGKGDTIDEGLVRIKGITGTVQVDNSLFQRGTELIELWTDNGAGTLDMTVQRSSFNYSIKEFVCNNNPQNVGETGIHVLVQGTHDAVFRIGDPAQTNPALGNTFLNNAFGSMTLRHWTGATGDIDAVISQNTFKIDDHRTGTNCPDGNFIFNIPQGGVLLDAGGGTFEALVTNNLFDKVMNASGGLGQLTIIGDDGGSSEFIVTGNEFRLPWQAAVRVVADGNNTMAIRFGGTGAEPNTYTDGNVTGEDLGAGSFPSPYWPWHLNVSNGGSMDITVEGEVLPLFDSAGSGQTHSFDSSMNSTGGTLNIFLKNSASPQGYKFNKNAAAGTFQIYRNGSAATGIAAILQANGNTGGGGADGTSPPSVSIPGSPVGFSDTAPVLPSITIP